jgi:hypothetical protein
MKTFSILMTDAKTPPLLCEKMKQSHDLIMSHRPLYDGLYPTVQALLDSLLMTKVPWELSEIEKLSMLIPECVTLSLQSLTFLLSNIQHLKSILVHPHFIDGVSNHHDLLSHLCHECDQLTDPKNIAGSIEHHLHSLPSETILSFCQWLKNRLKSYLELNKQTAKHAKNTIQGAFNAFKHEFIGLMDTFKTHLQTEANLSHDFLHFVHHFQLDMGLDEFQKQLADVLEKMSAQELLLLASNLPALLSFTQTTYEALKKDALKHEIEVEEKVLAEESVAMESSPMSAVEPIESVLVSPQVDMTELLRCIDGLTSESWSTMASIARQALDMIQSTLNVEGSAELAFLERRIKTVSLQKNDNGDTVGIPQAEFELRCIAALSNGDLVGQYLEKEDYPDHYSVLDDLKMISHGNFDAYSSM